MQLSLEWHREWNNLDRTSVRKPCDWPCDISQTIILSTVMEPNAETKYILVILGRPPKPSCLTFFLPLIFFANNMLEGRDDIRGEGWANFNTELYMLHFYFHLEDIRLFINSMCI